MANQFKIVLHEPEIPGNTGSIGRTCLAIGADLILIKPYGFEITEKAVRRAGLDYWKYISITEYNSWEDFIAKEKPSEQEIFLFSKSRDLKDQSYFQANFTKDSYLVFGKESSGLPDEIINQYQSRVFSLPINSEYVRSLNLSNAVTAAAYECLRKISE